MDKVLSVSIAAYNIEKFIDKCLGSFISPELAEGIEVIVVSDGSTDNTVRIAKKYEEQYPSLFRVIEKENGGWGSTVNAGLAAATGRYFRLLDGDDYYINENLRDFVRYLDKSTDDLVITPYRTFDDESGILLDEIRYNKAIEPRRSYHIEEVQNSLLVAMHACTFKTKQLQSKGIHITEKCFYTDVEYVLKGVNVSDTVSFFDLPIYMYRLGRAEQSVSVDSLIRRYKEHLKVLEGLLKYEREDLAEGKRQLFRKRMTEMVSIQYSIFLNMKPTSTIQRELKDFDLNILNNYPHYDVTDSRRLHLMRKTGYKGLSLIYLLGRVKGSR